MKVSLALLVLLLAAACTDIKAMSFRSATPKCCTKEELVRRKIPSSRIQGFRYTPDFCTIKAVLVTLRNISVCVDPEEKWFKDYLRTKKKTNTTST